MWGLVEKSLGVDYQVIRVITKIIVTFRYRVCNSYGVSLIFYGGENSDLVRIGQGNTTSVAICRD